VKHFDNDLVTFGMHVKQFGNDLAIGSDYFMATAKHLVTISKYSTTKTHLTTIYYCIELKCYDLTMTSHSATIVSFGNNNLKMHCEFANLETRWQINRTKYEIQF
jgi:hypothetical protein